MTFKIVFDDYILGVGEGKSGEEISQQEYDTLTSILRSMPVKEGYGYRLKTDLTWEEYKIEPEPQDLIDDTEALSILLGGDTE